MKSIFSALVVNFFFLLSCGLIRAPATIEGEPVVEAIPIELDRENPAPRSLGPITFLSGYELVSRHPRFGGLSGLHVSVDGGMLYAVSDHGYWFSASLHHDAQGRLLDLKGWKGGVLLTPEGVPVGGRLTDSEALARDRDGSFIVAFEQIHRLWRYPPPPEAFSSPARPVPTPPELEGAPANGGPEAVTVLPDGRLLIITEAYENPDGSLKAWLVDRERFFPLSYMPAEGFRVTDAVSLSSGDVLVLERHFSFAKGVAARIVRLSGANLRAGNLLKGEELARLEPPLAVDNFEGIAVWESGEAGTFLYLVSDDNYSPVQRTLLFQFRLEKNGGD